MKTLFSKLFLSFILINVMIIASVLTSFTLVYSRSYEEQVVGENKKNTEYVSLALYSFLNLAYKIVESLSHNSEVLSMDTETQNRIFAETVSRNEYFELLYAQGTDGMQTGRSAGELGSRRDRWWFIRMLETKKPFVSETYISISTDTICASIYFPMWKDGEMIGVMGSDISLLYLHDLVAEYSDDYSFSFIMDGKGVIVAHPDQTFIDELHNYATLTKTVLVRDEQGNPIKNSAGHDTIKVPIDISDAYKAPIQNMLRGEIGWSKFRENGKLLYMNNLPVRLNDYSDPWYVVTIRDGSHAMRARNAVILLVLISAAVISLATLLIVYFVSRNISSPINKVHSILQKIKDGDLTSEITVSSQDEIGEMMGMLKQTQDGIKVLISNVEKETAARARANEESKSKTSFLARMSHEIRTPMTAIMGMTELLLRGELSEEARSHMQDIKQAGNNLLSIINDILDFSKIEAGKMEILSEQYYLSALINDTVNIIKMRLEEKPIQFKTFIDGTIPNNLTGDVSRFRQILLNLLSNAVKYTNSGHISLSMMLLNKNEKLVWLKVEISDTGKGIKPEDQKRLFSDFARLDTKSNQGIEGTGLGLAIAKRLCNAMGGDISVKSKYGEGSTFTVMIPQIIESDEPISMAKEKGRVINKSAGAGMGVIHYTLPDVHLLIVDDFATNLKVVEGLIAPYKAKVDTCLSGEDSVKLIQKNEYDLVFMDHMMPGTDGLEATALIRKWESEVNKIRLPIVALTANAVVGMREMFMDNGFNDFLSKPVEVFKLNEIFDRWIPEEKKVIININLSEQDSGRDDSASNFSFLVLDSSLFNIPGIDVKNGLVMTSSTIEDYCKLLSLFVNDIEARLPNMQMGNALKDIHLFTTNVHAMKSAAAFIGADELSKKAMAMEEAGKTGNAASIKEGLSAFLEYLNSTVKNIRAVLNTSV